MMRSIKTKGLPGTSHRQKIYTFFLDDRKHPTILYIPGDLRGPDVCIPECAEQEEWLNTLSNLVTHTWDCQWTFITDDGVDDFLTLLNPLVVAAEG
jgi:hypothetical protein